MPLERTAALRGADRRARGIKLREAFLYAVLAKVALPPGRGGEDVCDRKCLGNSDQADIGRIAVSLMRRRVNSAAHLSETACDHTKRADLKARAYLMTSSIALTCSAYWPVGASFMYSRNGAFASGSLP